MNLELAFLAILLGMALLYWGAEFLIRGAVQLALNAGLPRLVVGLTIVSLSTSMPEAISSLVAQWSEGRGDIALGNVIGSNIANIGLIAGVAALIRPLPLNRLLQDREISLMVGITILLMILMSFGSLQRWQGGVLLLGLLGYILLQMKASRGEKVEFEEELDHELTPKEKGKDILFIALGGLLLVAGGYALIQGAVFLAKTFGVSDRVIGLTLVALGTSLPELATSIVAILKGETDISIGNVVGSNVFNILFVTGGVAAIRPVIFSPQLLHVDALVMLVFSLALWGLVWRQTVLARWRGGVLLGAYAGYVVGCYGGLF